MEYTEYRREESSNKSIWFSIFVDFIIKIIPGIVILSLEGDSPETRFTALYYLGMYYLGSFLIKPALCFFQAPVLRDSYRKPVSFFESMRFFHVFGGLFSLIYGVQFLILTKILTVQPPYIFSGFYNHKFLFLCLIAGIFSISQVSVVYLCCTRSKLYFRRNSEERAQKKVKMIADEQLKIRGRYTFSGLVN